MKLPERKSWSNVQINVRIPPFSHYNKPYLSYHGCISLPSSQVSLNSAVGLKPIQAACEFWKPCGSWQSIGGFLSVTVMWRQLVLHLAEGGVRDAVRLLESVKGRGDSIMHHLGRGIWISGNCESIWHIGPLIKTQPSTLKRNQKIKKKNLTVKWLLCQTDYISG